MAQFLGCWKSDSNTHKNLDAYAKVAGITGDMLEKFRTAENTVVFKQNGEKWTMDFTSSIAADKTYEFTPGQELDTKDPWGNPCKFTITFDSDTKMTEIVLAEMMQWKPEKVTREIKGDRMYCVHEMEGVQMTTEMVRC